jgi:hypothetical protein
MTNRISRGSYSVGIDRTTVHDYSRGSSGGVPGARIDLQGPGGSGNFEVSLDFLAAMAREFYDVCALPEQAAAMPRPRPEQPLVLVTPVDHATWIDRAMYIHKALRERKLEWATEGIPKVATLKTDMPGRWDTHDITAAIHDFGMASFWQVSYGSSVVAGSEASFEMAFVAASEEVLKIFDTQAEGAKETLQT